MERFGRPRFRGGARAPKPYGSQSRQTQNRSGGILGQSPRQSSGQFGSYNNARSNQRASGMLQKSPAGPHNVGSRAASGNRQSEVNVPSEVRHLMQTLGLSQSDMQKLSQLPEKELSVNNLAKAIGDLKQAKQSSSARSGPFVSTSNPPKRSNSFQRGREENRGFKNNEGLLGSGPSPRGFQGRSGQRSPSGNRSFDSPGNRHSTTGFKATVKSTDTPPSLRSRLSDSKSGFGDRREFANKDQRQEYQEEQRLYGRRRSAEQFERSRNDSFTSSSRRSNEANFSNREVHSKPAQFGNERRVVRQRDPPNRGAPGHRPVGTRNVSKPTVASTLPSLLDLPVPSKARGPSGGILGNAPQSGSKGLEKLVAAVGGSSSLLTPLMIASQSDPSVLEAQIQAMKVLQAQAIKMQSGGGREKEHPVRRSPPISRANLIERRMQDEARRESQAMRSAKGRVLYMKYKSPRILEKDLRQLASAFGKVTRLFIIKPKSKIGSFQAFMEMDSWDGAAAMVERYIAKPPNIKGFPVDVQRSNYGDLQPKSELLKSGKRTRSISPIRRGTAQAPFKRERRDEKPSLSITTSRTEKRIVSQGNDDRKPHGKITDAREILRRKSLQDKSDKKQNSEEKDEEVQEENEEDEAKQSYETEPSKENEKKDNEAEKNKEDFDPLDALADELALHDEFVLMDEVGYGQKKQVDEDDSGKIISMDLDESELDLDDVKVEVSQDEQEAAEMALKEEKMKNLIKESSKSDENVVASVLDEIIDTVLYRVEMSGQADFDEEMAAMQEFNVSEDEIHEYSYGDDSAAVSEEDYKDASVNDEEDKDVSAKEQEFKDVPAPEEEYKDFPAEEEEYKDVPAQEEEYKDASAKTEEYTDAAAADEEEYKDFSAGVDVPEASGEEEEMIQEEDNANEVRTQMVLKEVLEAKVHLDALVKVTKAKAAQACAKKLRVCLEVAISHLEGGE